MLCLRKNVSLEVCAEIRKERYVACEVQLYAEIDGKRKVDEVCLDAIVRFSNPIAVESSLNADGNCS